MNNFKKIGLSALAGSLVATSVFAGSLSVTGDSSMTFENYTGDSQNNSKAFSMGNSVNFAGSGELDNGLTVSIAFELDQGAADGTQTAAQLTADGAVFDSHSISVSSDTLGSVTLHGHGGSSAQGALDTTAAGDMWDNFDAAGDGVKSSVGGNNLLVYTLPTMMDGLSVSASYANKVSTTSESSYAYGLTYTGVDGLTVKYGVGDDNTTAASTAEATTMMASYAYGPITVSASDTDYDDQTATDNRSVDSVNISYTVSDALSISYGEEEITDATASAVAAQYTGFKAAYTAGGMTLTAVMQTGENVSYTTAASEDKDYYSLGLAFAF